MAPASPTHFDSAAVPSGREELAKMIVKAFADAGFGPSQQLAGLANAIAESNLNPQAKSAAPDESVGLFQLNRQVGLGKGRTVAELQDPMTNIDTIIKEAHKHSDFANAASLEDAVDIFVRKLVRPPNPADAVTKRIAIAKRL